MEKITGAQVSIFQVYNPRNLTEWHEIHTEI